MFSLQDLVQNSLRNQDQNKLNTYIASTMNYIVPRMTARAQDGFFDCVIDLKYLSLQLFKDSAPFANAEAQDMRDANNILRQLISMAPAVQININGQIHTVKLQLHELSLRYVEISWRV